MNKRIKVIISGLVILFVFSQTQGLSQTRERAEVSAEYQWKLEDLYATQQAWSEAKEKLVARFDEVEKYQGKLAESASELLACL